MLLGFKTFIEEEQCIYLLNNILKLYYIYDGRDIELFRDPCLTKKPNYMVDPGYTHVNDMSVYVSDVKYQELGC